MLKLSDGRTAIRAMLTLAIPISLQNLITFAVSFADNLMIGSLGDTAISAVYMGTQVQTFLQMAMNGIAPLCWCWWLSIGASRIPDASGRWRPLLCG